MKSPSPLASDSRQTNGGDDMSKFIEMNQMLKSVKVGDIYNIDEEVFTDNGATARACALLFIGNDASNRTTWRRFSAGTPKGPSNAWLFMLHGGGAHPPEPIYEPPVG